MTPSKESSRTFGPAFWAVLALAAVLRLFGLARHSLWYDEGASLYLARFVDLKGSLFDAADTTEPPMMAIFSWLWQGVLGLLPFAKTSWVMDGAVRLLPLGFGLAGVVVAYVGVNALLKDRRAALLSMALMALAPLQVYYAQEFRIYTFYVLLGLLAVGAMALAVESNQRRYWVAMVLCLATLMYSHFFSMILIFTLNVAFVLSMPWYYRRLPQWFGWNLLLMALIAPALYLAFRMSGEMNAVEWQWYPRPTLKTGLITFKDLIAGFTPRAWAYWPLFAAAAAGTLGGLFTLRQRPALLVAGASVVVVPITFGIIYWSRAPFNFYEHRLFILSGAVALILCGVALARLPRRVLPAVLLPVVVLLLASLQDVYRDRLHPIDMHRIAMWNKVELREPAAEIAANWREGDLVAHLSHFTQYSMYYYLDKPQRQIGVGEEDIERFHKLMGRAPILESLGFVPVPIAEAIAGIERLWIPRSYGVTFEDPAQTDRVLSALGEEWEHVGQTVYDGLVLLRYERKSASPERLPS